MALRTRSLLSFTAESGRPTRLNCGSRPKVGFDLHDVPRQTGHTKACHFCIHGLFPTFLLFYQYTAQRALAQARNGKNQAKLNKIRLTGLQKVGIFRVS